MNQLLTAAWREDDGLLSFEWILLITLLVIGLVSGWTAIRDAVIDEFGDLAEATISWDQSYTFAGVPGLLPPSTFDDVQLSYSDCGRLGP